MSQRKPNLSEIYKSSENIKGKRPIIFVPGILGSELVHEDTGEKLWFSFSRSENEDLKLPVALRLDLSRDKLVPRDILRKVDLRILPDVEIYEGLIEALTKHGGYEEASWQDPPENLEDKLFVFPYDWRRDNVETGQFLLEEIIELKRKTKRPDQKFNILAHSMGGLITRYAAMYGLQDLKRGKQRPNWSGAKHFRKVFFFGTPNQGSASSLEALIKGKSSLGGTVKVPFVRYLTPIEIATMPAVFQLLPHEGTARFYNGKLKPIRLDLYDVKNWRKFGWAIFGNEKYLKEYSEAERGRLEQYLGLVLERAKKFHRALNAKSSAPNALETYTIGSDCSPTLDALVVYKKGTKWMTVTKPRTFRNSNGTRVTPARLREIMLVPGDGSVTRQSLLARTSPTSSTLFVCENHDRITGNATILNNVLKVLLSDVKSKSKKKRMVAEKKGSPVAQ